MLQLKVDASELYDEAKEEFINTNLRILQLEHSLISISKWESRQHKTFLSKTEKTESQIIDYIRCMTINSNVEPEVYLALTDENLAEINRYINNPMSASFFAKEPEQSGRGEPMTSELIYYWMTYFNIPWEAEKWHLNRLLNLIKIAKMKSSTKNRRNSRDLLSQQAAMNAARREAWGTKG